MADDIQIVSDMLTDFVEDKVKTLIEKKEWMEKCTFTLVRKREDFSALVDLLISKGLCSLDLETTSLNTRIRQDGKSIARIVGICLAVSETEGWYVPVSHEDREYNLPYDFALRELARLVKNCRCIFHNFKYDGQLLYNHGIVIEDETTIEDTYLMAGVVDASNKERGLKSLSEKLLDRPMIAIEKLGLRSGKKDILRFDMVPPQIALYYGGGDAVNTFALFKYFSADLDRQDPDRKHGPWVVYERIEKRCLFPVMQMERNLCRIDAEYLKALKVKLEEKNLSLLKTIRELAGRDFDVNSPKQLGTLLFEEMKVRYPEREKTASGQYMTGEDTLQKLSDVPIVGFILQHRAIEKIVGTYVDNFLKNVDEQGFVKFQMNQLQADTGRFSASGGRGLHEDGYCGVNCQNIPVPDDEDPEAPDIRKAIVARPGYKITTIDYSGEELRIAANFSREPKWIEEFTHGTADLHTMTAKIIHAKNEVNKKERNLGKRINFLTLYGGGAAGFAAQTKIPYDQAKKMIINFFRGYSTLKRWIDSEIKVSRKRGYSVTAFGRRRPLEEFYRATDEKIKAKGDRCAVNSRIQGCLQPHVRCLTSEGYIPIGELRDIVQNKPDIKVWTGISWERFFVMNRGECQTARLELSNGMALDCDIRHEVLVPTATGYTFKKFSELQKGDEVCLSYPRELEFGRYPDRNFFSGGTAHNAVDVVIGSESDWDFIAYVLGTVVGDGSVRHGERSDVTISFGITKAKANYDRLWEGFKKLGITLSPLKRSKGSVGVSYRASVTSKALVDILTYLGYTGHDARSKRIPEYIYRAPLAMRRAFLKGYHDTDGCKKTDNGYTFHTPNRELLLGVQRLAWTLGLACTVNDNDDGSNTLSWSDRSAIEQFLGINVLVRKRCTCKSVLLPSFLYPKIYELLKSDGRYVKDMRDKALVCKLNKGKKVLLTTALALLKKYGCETPDVYFTTKISKKIIDDHTEETYTLSVDSPLHRFDSDCVISKNTGADIIKMALYRVWKWIRDNGYGNDVRMLMPVHDEVVFEIKEDKLDFYIPEICEIMCLKDLIDALGWPIPLEVDAEYGDSFHVDKEFKLDAEKQVSQPKPSIKTPEPVPTVIPVQQAQETKPAKQDVSSSSAAVEPGVPNTTTAIQTSSESKHMHFSITLRETILAASEKARTILDDTELKAQEEALKDARVKDRIDKRGVLVYPIENLDPITLHQFKAALSILIGYGDALFIGPICRVALVNKSTGEVWFESSKKVSVDAFLALCFWLKI